MSRRKPTPKRPGDVATTGAALSLTGLSLDTLEALDAEAAARSVPRLHVIREWLDRVAAGVCPTCKGTGRR